MNAELKSLIEDAAKLLGKELHWNEQGSPFYYGLDGKWNPTTFNPLDPERGDLMKVADAAGLVINFPAKMVFVPKRRLHFHLIKDDHDSLALAVLRAASAVLKARNGNAAE